MFQVNQPFTAFKSPLGIVVFNRGDLLSHGCTRQMAREAERVVVIPISRAGHDVKRALPLFRCDDCLIEEWSKVTKTIPCTHCECKRLSYGGECALCFRF